MISNLQDYIARKGIPVRTSKSQSGAEVIQNSFTMAQSMADAIKMKGIDGTQFYSDTFNDESYRELTEQLSKVIGQEVEFRLITEFKK
jgi:PBP1b-binding outer membrane lipoprotein LpoB